MHRYNNKYGYGDILRRYCGAPETTPIWGEVQHSLFLNTRYFTAAGKLGPPREQLQKFPRLLSWQKLLPFPYQVPIGDPLLYSAVRNGSPQDSPLQLASKEFAVFMPKLNDEVPVIDRTVEYQRTLREAIERVAPLPVVLALHPREYEHREAILRQIGGDAEVVWAPERYPGGSIAWSQQLIQQAKLVVSDYFGAHVFRSTALFRTPTLLLGASLFNPGFHPVMANLARDFLEAMGDTEAQQVIAKRALGSEYQRSPQELADILGFVGTRRLMGRPVRVLYQRVRRARVRLRRRVAGN